MRHAVGAVVLGASLASLVAVTPTEASAVSNYLSVHAGNVYLSPNGDGHRDRVDLVIELLGPANVSVSVGGEGRVGNYFLGELDGELDVIRYRWRWDGRIDGQVVPDGVYFFTVSARHHGGVDRAGARAFVDTVRDRGVLEASGRTVYPAATAVRDVAVLTYVAEWRSWRRAPVVRVHLTVTAPGGRVVHRGTHRVMRPFDRLPYPRASSLGWSARRPLGNALPEGTYTARVNAFDAAGNRTRRVARVQVSHRQLEEKVLTVSRPAGQFAWRQQVTESGDAIPTPRPSLRFDGGLHFRSRSVALFHEPYGFTSKPTDAWRVTATGGPEVPGDDGFGRLDSTYTDAVQVGPGDATVSSGWIPHWEPGRAYIFQLAKARWRFSGRFPSSYDVATFAVEYRRYVPVD